jgi:hypothetical protein
MRAPDVGMLSPDDAARLRRWQAAGHPPIPLLTDIRGRVHATTDNLATVLRATDPAWRWFRESAVRWVDEHCGEG